MGAVLCCAVLSWLASGVAYATNIQIVQLDEQAAASDVVVEGSVERQWYETPALAHGVAVTRSLVTVTHEYKGHVASGQVVVTTPGGIDADGVEYSIAATPRLAIGDVVIVHLIASDESQARLHNWAAGLLFLGDGTAPVLDGQRRPVSVDAEGRVLPLVDGRLDEALRVDDARQLVADSVVDGGRSISGYTGGGL